MKKSLPQTRPEACSEGRDHELLGGAGVDRGLEDHDRAGLEVLADRLRGRDHGLEVGVLGPRHGRRHRDDHEVGLPDPCGVGRRFDPVAWGVVQLVDLCLVAPETNRAHVRRERLGKGEADVAEADHADRLVRLSSPPSERLHSVRTHHRGAGCRRKKGSAPDKKAILIPDIARGDDMPSPSRRFLCLVLVLVFADRPARRGREHRCGLYHGPFGPGWSRGDPRRRPPGPSSARQRGPADREHRTRSPPARPLQERLPRRGSPVLDRLGPAE